ncbi:MAG TPA: cobalamin B12-binding domain-containing protein [Chloroflexota bacterium]|nr:cobalamin B12-binding domain-containing protein [Chloroflexota bacterium]
MRRHGERIRVVVAKPGLDGHDKGAKIVARLLRDAGMEVIYTGLHRSVEDIVSIAMQEDADVIGLSVLSGAHVPLSKRLLQRLNEENMRDDVLVLVGGVIPAEDVQKLKDVGVDGVFPVATPFEDIVAFIQEKVA